MELNCELQLIVHLSDPQLYSFGLLSLLVGGDQNTELKENKYWA